MSSGKLDKADDPSSAQDIQELFGALIDELDRALERSSVEGLSDEDRDRIHRARAAALRGLALARRLDE